MPVREPPPAYGVHTTDNGQPKVSIGVRDYVDLALSHERELEAERRKAVLEKFVTIEVARRIAKEEVEQSRALREMQILEKFATVETARVIAKDEVERARVQLAQQVEDARTALAKLVQTQTRAEGTVSIVAGREEEARVGLKGLLTKQARQEGVSDLAHWIAPSGTAVLALIFALGSFLIALFVLLGHGV